MPNRENMSFYAKAAAVAAAIAVMAAPAFAADPPAGTPDQHNNPGAVHQPDSTPPSNDGTVHKPDSTPPSNQGTGHKPDTPSNDGTEHKPTTPGPNASLPAKAKAYGRHCKGESKKRADAAPGTNGTPFSQCVTAMAKLANGTTTSPRKACKELSKKHEEGEKGTQFSRCVSQGAKLLREHDDDGEK
jgi:hypothetical protein